MKSGTAALSGVNIGVKSAFDIMRTAFTFASPNDAVKYDSNTKNTTENQTSSSLSNASASSAR
jgi:hypothetical protein